MLLGVIAGPAIAQHGDVPQDNGHESGHGHDHAGAATSGPKWEGSPEGVAYSERNHHLAGLFVLLIALTELREALKWTRLAWSRFLLPAAMLGAGGFLLIWSDHEAWPIGSLSFAQTFFGNDHEIVQHKLYGVLLLTVGAIESLRRAGRLAHAAWAAPLPIFAIIGGLMLFLHSHGDHPSAQKIALHHAAMGVMAITAGSCRLVSGRTGARPDQAPASRWALAWAGLILLIGVQLLFYSE
jgi:putative copper resistance protein D